MNPNRSLEKVAEQVRRTLLETALTDDARLAEWSDPLRPWLLQCTGTRPKSPKPKPAAPAEPTKPSKPEKPKKPTKPAKPKKALTAPVVAG